ncbi:UNVERIFIED_ORG: hypothetical protein J2Y84_003039 [Pseudomonas reinekei]
MLTQDFHGHRALARDHIRIVKGRNKGATAFPGQLQCIWMYRDARKRGLSAVAVVPYLLITAVFVSVGPLLYLVVRGIQDRKKLPAATRQL